MATASQTAQNVLGTTATGAAVGSVVPGIGTALGAGVGAAVGIGAALFDYFVSNGDDPATAAAKARQYDSTFVATPAQLASRNFDPTMDAALAQGAAGFRQSQAVGARQTSLADSLQARADGTGGPSLAELQLRQSTDRNVALAGGLVAAQRGINPGLAARLGSQAQGAANQQLAGQAAILRAQEQQGAQALLANALGQQRGQDLAQQGAAAGLYSAAGGFAGQQRGQDLQNQQQTQALNADVAAGNQRAQLAAAGLAQGTATADADRAQRTVAAVAQGAGAVGALTNTQPGTTPPAAPAGAAPASSRPPSGSDPRLRDGYAEGGVVPGRAPDPGDSKRNDLVRALLSPGEIVLPRSITMAPDAEDRAAEFVGALLRRSRAKRVA